MVEEEVKVRKLNEAVDIYMEESKETLEKIVSKEITKGMGIEDFTLVKVIGVGSYGKVMLVKMKEDGQIYAMKMLRKDHIAKRNQIDHTKTERNVLETIRFPFIVRLRYAFQNPKKLYFVLEYCPGGELFFHLQRLGRFDEEKTKFYAAQLLLAIEHLHKNDVIYRDLKPENVLIDKDGYCKITDFGLSKENISDNQGAKSFCGTPEYLAPEILKRVGHGRAVDWWSLGAIIFEMLTGLPPFYTQDREKLFSNIKFAELKYPYYISPSCKDLLEKLFIKDPEKRLGGTLRDATEIKEHPWFASIDFAAMLKKELKVPYKPKLAGDGDTKYVAEEFKIMPAVDSGAVGNQDIIAGATKDPTYEGFTYNENEDKDKFLEAGEEPMKD